MDEKYIDALKALSEPNRLRLFWLLVHIDKRISVAEAMDVIGETQYNVSRNLKTLYKAGLLTPKKQGKWVYYTLNEHKQPHWKYLVESIKMLPEDNFSDVTKLCLKRLAMRVNDECVISANSDEWQSVINDNG